MCNAPTSWTAKDGIIGKSYMISWASALRPFKFHVNPLWTSPREYKEHAAHDGVSMKDG